MGTLLRILAVVDLGDLGMIGCSRCGTALHRGRVPVRPIRLELVVSDVVVQSGDVRHDDHGVENKAQVLQRAAGRAGIWLIVRWLNKGRFV